MKNILILTFLLLIKLNFSYAQNLPFPDIDGFQKSIRNDVYYPDNLYDLINGGSDAYIEYNFINLHLCEYTKGGLTVTVELYNHENPQNAFGIYSSERSPDYNFIKIGTEGYKESSLINFFQNKYYVKINGFDKNDNAFDSDLMQIANSISSAIGGKNNFPEIIEKLPKEGKIKYSEKYINNSFLGYRFIHNVYQASYNKDKEFTLFIIDNTKAMECLKQIYNENNLTVKQTKDNIYVLKDQYNGKLILKVMENDIIGTINCNSKKKAVELFNLFL